MNNIDQQNPEFFNNQKVDTNSLLNYIQSLNPQTVTQLSKPDSPEAWGAIEGTINSMLGGLPSENFNVMITTNRDSLAKLLVSAMLNGYLLRNVEQRLEFEKSLQSLEVNSPDNV